MGTLDTNGVDTPLVNSKDGQDAEIPQSPKKPTSGKAAIAVFGYNDSTAACHVN